MVRKFDKTRVAEETEENGGQDGKIGRQGKVKIISKVP